MTSQNAIDRFKLKAMLKELDEASGSGTSMITLMIPPKQHSVQSAIKSTQQRLKRYGNKCPKQGLAIFCGLAETAKGAGKERLILVDLEPTVRPVTSLVYKCDSRFHTQYLDGMMIEGNEEAYGFIVLDGNSALFGRVKGKYREVLREISVDLPNKHRRGGQSALRFARLRDQARHAYVKKVAEACPQLFLSGCQPNVRGLVVAGSADLKNDLIKCKALDQRLTEIVVASVDIAYGGRRGFDEAIERSVQMLCNVELAEENRILNLFFDQVEQDSGLYCFAVPETLAALEMGAVEDLILWEDSDAYLLVSRDPVSSSESILPDSATVESVETSREPLVEWLCDHYHEFGCRLHLVSGSSTLGTQFVRGFGGLGGVLRFRVAAPPADLVERAAGSDEEDSTRSSVGSYGFDEGDFGF